MAELAGDTYFTVNSPTPPVMSIEEFVGQHNVPDQGLVAFELAKVLVDEGLVPKRKFRRLMEVLTDDAT